MIWAVYLMLGTNMWWEESPEVIFDDEAWEIIIKEVQKAGLNMIVLDLAEGVQYGSHPELAHPGAWKRSRVRAEVKRLKEMGITLIPKLNFSATHHLWLGEYRKMMSTKVYYDVCRDLIQEVYELFGHPEYIHLAMDEEGNQRILKHQKGFVSYRGKDLLFHDLEYLCECVMDTGAKPWIWEDTYNDYPEEFKKRIKSEDILISVGYYHAFKKEHYKLIESDPMYVEFYSQDMFDGLNLKYVEDDPAIIKFREKALPVVMDGYNVVPCGSTFNKNDYNADDLLDYYKTNAPCERVKGFMTAPWIFTTMEYVDEIVKGIHQLRDAKNKYYQEK